MGANVSQTVVPEWPELIKLSLPNTPVAVKKESTAVSGKSTAVPGKSTAVPGKSTAVPGKSTAVPGKSAVLNTGFRRNSDSHGNSSGKKRKRMEMQEDSWPVCNNRGIKRKRMVMETVAEDD